MNDQQITPQQALEYLADIANAYITRLDRPAAGPVMAAAQNAFAVLRGVIPADKEDTNAD